MQERGVGGGWRREEDPSSEMSSATRSLRGVASGNLTPHLLPSEDSISRPGGGREDIRHADRPPHGGAQRAAAQRIQRKSQKPAFPEWHPKVPAGVTSITRAQTRDQVTGIGGVKPKRCRPGGEREWNEGREEVEGGAGAGGWGPIAGPSRQGKGAWPPTRPAIQESAHLLSDADGMNHSPTPIPHLPPPTSHLPLPFSIHLTTPPASASTYLPALPTY